MSLWPAIVKTALLGTERAELPMVTAVSPLTDLLHQIDITDPEAALLAMAGLIDLHEQAGSSPAQTAPLSEQPPADTEKPEPPAHVTRHLSLMLDGKYGDLLSEYLHSLALAGFCVPAIYLPNLLDKGAKMVAIRPFLLPVLGQRGSRLAAQNPAWGFATLIDNTRQNAAAQWQQTEPGKRYGLLRQLRQTEPDKGRQMLETTWRTESDMVRSQLIKLMYININMTDEPFLERALDDRNHLVRNKAAELLTYLPESRLCRRMLTYTRQLLIWTPQNKHQIAVRFPVITNGMMRDGIFHRTDMDKTRLRMRQLIQMVTAVPLTHWTTTWHVTPADIIRALPTTRWQNTLTTAFVTAAHRQQDVVWTAAILETIGISDRTARLVSILPEGDCYALVGTVTDKLTTFPSLAKGSPTRLILSQWAKPWSEEMGHYWLKLFAQIMQQGSETKYADPTITTITRKFAKLCPPSLADTAAYLLNADNIHDIWKPAAQTIVDTLSFRQAMSQEIEAAAEE
ncbi:MAG: hypothetical protein KC421_21760 [Anaerolineales bacterium]|nr:hypothetical protein [Anaerolineales bacterium]